jgi:hypothetical protein
VERLIEQRPTLPRILLSVRDHLPRSPRQDAGVLFHDLSLSELIRLSAGVDRPRAVDLDTVEGLTPDAAALAFLTDRLGIQIVITRRPALALRAVSCLCSASTAWTRPASSVRSRDIPDHRLALRSPRD